MAHSRARLLAPMTVLVLAACSGGTAESPSPIPASQAQTPMPSATIGPYAGAEAVIPMAGQPRGVAYAAGSIWVANALGDVVQRVDPGTNAVVAELDVGARPITLVNLGEQLWVSVLNGDPESDDELVLIDTDANAGDSRVVVPVRHNIAAGGGLLWVQDLNGNLRSVDPDTGSVADVTTSGLQPVALAANDVAVYGIRGNGTAWRWPIAGDGELLETSLGVAVPGRSRVWAGGDGLWVAVPGDVYALDPTTLEVVAHLSLPEMSLVNDLWGSETDLWLSAHVESDALGLDGGSILELDPMTLEIRRTLPLGEESSGVVVAEGSVWGVDQSLDQLARYPVE
jgi:hypothetical protein